ncbi:MAG: SEC-C metal-binding domain-containing protein [Christensenellales bacterium]|jgi:hypothetical protein
MSYYEDWTNLTENNQTQQFWAQYFSLEQKNYEKILDDSEHTFSGSYAELAKEFDMDETLFIGFLDGINTSLRTGIDVKSVEADTAIQLDIDLEKLYFNMLDAKADWLYNLPQWDDLLNEERRKEITKEYRASIIAVSNKVGRNEPCPCGSGKKYKKCCGTAKAS